MDNEERKPKGYWLKQMKTGRKHFVGLSSKEAHNLQTVLLREGRKAYRRRVGDKEWIVNIL